METLARGEQSWGQQDAASDYWTSIRAPSPIISSAQSSDHHGPVNSVEMTRSPSMSPPSSLPLLLLLLAAVSRLAASPVPSPQLIVKSQSHLFTNQAGRQAREYFHVFFIFLEKFYFSVSQKYLLIPTKYFFSLDRLDGRAAHGGTVLAKH